MPTPLFTPSRSPSGWGRHQLLLLLCLSLGLPSAWAQKRVALVLGNAQYQQEAALRNPVNDAALLARTLKASPLRFDEVLTLNNGTRGQMLQQLARFGKLAQGADVALLYYSGHGMINSKRQNHVLPVDMPKISANADLDADAALKSYGISETELIEAVEGAKVQVLVLDACRDNGFGEQKSGSKGLARRPDQSKNRLIAYATEEGRTAEDGKGQNSTYAQSLAKHLVRTDLPLLSVFDEVANDVERQTANQQSPTRSGNLRTSVYLLASLVPVVVPPAPEPGPSAAQIEQQAWAAAQRSNSQAAYHAYLNEYPRGSYAGAARVALAGLQPVVTPAQVCDYCPEMVVIPAGSFQMGSNDDDSEKPVHSVNVKSFALGKYEVTQGQWQAVMGSNPSYFKDCGASCPVERVSWDDIQQYLQKLNAKSGQQYRLPSEAEWEYAARAGSTGQWNFGSDESQLGQHAWYNGNSGYRTHPIAQKQDNALGVYDMHGNVWEWVQDYYHDSYKLAPTDGRAWISGGEQKSRVLRGGSWDSTAAGLRSAYRSRGTPDIRSGSYGFRLARTLLTP